MGTLCKVCGLLSQSTLDDKEKKKREKTIDVCLCVMNVLLGKVVLDHIKRVE